MLKTYKLPTSFYAEIRYKIPVSDIVGSYVNLKRKGAEFLGLCPFHSEKSPSLTVNDKKGFYHCFGCGAHGDGIKFISMVDNILYQNAAIKIANKYGMTIPKPDSKEELKSDERQKIYNVMEQAAIYYESKLGTDAIQYLLGRGFTKEIISKYRIGYAQGSQGIVKYMSDKFISQELLKNSGLISENNSGSHYEFFRERVMFPIITAYGKVVGFGGRVIKNIKPKYLNSPETEIFKKKYILYGENFATDASYKKNMMLVVEGYIDVIVMQENGFLNTVGSLGTAISENHLSRIWKAVDEIVICMDGDEAGFRAASRVIDIALLKVTPSKSLSFVILPKGYDPDTIIREQGTEKMQELINSRKMLSEMIWSIVISEVEFKSAESRAKLEHNFMVFAAKITDKIVKRNFVNFFYDKAYRHFRSVNLKLTKKYPDIPKVPGELEVIEISIMKLVINFPMILFREEVSEELTGIEFSNKDLNDFKIWILEYIMHRSREDKITKEDIRHEKFYQVYEKICYNNGVMDNIDKDKANLVWDKLIRQRCLLEVKREYFQISSFEGSSSSDLIKGYEREIKRLQEEINNISTKILNY